MICIRDKLQKPTNPTWLTLLMGTFFREDLLSDRQSETLTSYIVETYGRCMKSFSEHCFRRHFVS